LLVERWILARLRHRTFFSLAELNDAIAQLLERLNDVDQAVDNLKSSIARLKEML